MSDFRIDKITNRVGDAGTQIAGISTFSGTSGMVMPGGPTAYRGGRGRGVLGSGYNPGNDHTMDFIEIATTGNAVDFGNSEPSNLMQLGAVGSSTRGVLGGGSSPSKVLYYTFSSAGGVSDFGEQTLGRRGNGTANDSTRGLFAGGAGNTSPLNAPAYNIIDYVTIASTGGASDFGDMTRSSRQVAGCSSPTRGLFAGGYNTIPTGLQVGPGTVNNIIDYVTIQSKGDAKDFGDLTVARSHFSGGSNATRGLFVTGGSYASPACTNYNIIDYVTIATTGNAADFGDTVQTAIHNTGTACSQTRGVFAGGYTSPAGTNIISHATIATTGNAVDFGDMTSARGVGNDGATSDVNGGLG